MAAVANLRQSADRCGGLQYKGLYNPISSLCTPKEEGLLAGV